MHSSFLNAYEYMENIFLNELVTISLKYKHAERLFFYLLFSVAFSETELGEYLAPSCKILLL